MKSILTFLFILITMTCLISSSSATDSILNDTHMIDSQITQTTTYNQINTTQNNIQINENNYKKQDNEYQIKKEYKNTKNGVFTADVTISVDPVNNLKVGDYITVSNSMDNAMASSDLTLFVNNKNVTTFARNSQTTYQLTQSGTNTIYALYPGDGMLWDDIQSNVISLNVADSNQNITVNDTNNTSTIELTSDKNTVNINETFSIYTSVSPDNATGLVSVYVNNQNIGSYDISSGGANMALPASGLYTFYAVYNGDNYYSNSTSNTLTITVVDSTEDTGLNSSIKLSSSTSSAKVNESFDIYTTVEPADVTGIVTVYINNQEIGSYDVKVGGSKIALPASGEYEFYAVYAGNQKYNTSTSNKITVNVIEDTNSTVNDTNSSANDTNTTSNNTNSSTKTDTVILAEDMYMDVGHSKVLNFTLVDINSNPISGQELYITLDGKTEGPVITESDGGVRINFTNYDEESGMASGKYPFTITYNGNDNYNPSSKTVTLTIATRLINTTITIKANNTQLNYGESFTITPTVTPHDYLHLENNTEWPEVVILSVYKDGVLNNTLTCYPDYYWIFDSYLPGVYTFNATYNGSDIMNPSTSNVVTVTVVGDEPVINDTVSIAISVSDNTIEVGDSLSIFTPVTPSGVSGTVDLYCNGVIISNYNAAVGGGSLTMTEAGNYTFYAVYNGETTTATSDKVTVEVINPNENSTVNDTNTTDNTTVNDTNTTDKIDTVILAEDMYMRVGSSIMMNFTLLDANGRPVGSQELYLTIDGETQGPAITESDGSVHLNFTNYDEESGMASGVYELTITYAGNESYNPTSKTVLLTIATRYVDSTITIEANNTQLNYGESFTITPTVDPHFMLYPENSTTWKEVVILSVYKDGVLNNTLTCYPDYYWTFTSYLPGVYTFNATYNGSSVMYPSTSNVVTVTINGESPVINDSVSIGISVSDNRIEVGDSLSIRTPVTPSGVSGTVTLYCNGVELNTYNAGVGGGSLTMTEAGNYTFYAVYKGDNVTATSANVTVEVIDPNAQEDKLELETYIGIDTIGIGQSFGVLITPTPDNYTGKINVSYIDPSGKKHTMEITYPDTNGVKLNLSEIGTYTFYSYIIDDPVYNTVYSNNVTIKVTDGKEYELKIEVWPDQTKFARSTTVLTTQSLKDATGNITYVIDGEDFVTYPAKTLLNNQPSFIFDKAGNITIQARYDGDDYGVVYSNKEIFEYLPLESVIEADDITVKQGEIAEITIRLIDEDGYIIRVDENDIPVGNQSIFVEINNKTYGPFKTNSDGQTTYSINTSSLKIGSYPIKIIYNGGVWENLTVYDAYDGLYEDYGHKAVNKIIILTVTGEKNTTITASDVTMYVSDNEVLNITVTDDNGLINPNVTVKIDDKNYPISIKDNLATVDLSELTEGKHTLKIEYSPDSTHKTSNKTVTIQVNKKQPVITLNDIKNNNVGDTVIIKGKLSDYDKKEIANADIEIKIKTSDKSVNEEITVKTNANGEYEYHYTIIKAGEYEIKVESPKNNTHEKAKSNLQFNTTRKNITITVKSDKNTYYVSDKIIITTTTSANDITGNITLNLDGKTVTLKNNEKYEYIPTKESTIKINATYPGDDKYNDAKSQTITLTVKKQTPTLTVNKIDRTPINTQITITGKLTADNKVVADANVTVNINNMTQIVKTDKNGVYELKYTTNKLNTNNVSVTYPADNKYNQAQNATTFTVYDNTAAITLKTDKKSYTVGESITITATVTPSNATGKVTLNINGLIINANVNKSVKIVADNATTMTIKAKYNGDNTYKQTNEVSVNVVVNKINTKITLESINNSKTNTSILIKGKLTDVNDNVLSNENVTVIINDNHTISTKTDNNGYFQTTYMSLEAKQNSIKAVYNGNDKYNSSHDNITDNVSKLTTKIVVNRIEGIIGENITLVANITDENNNPVNGGKVIFKLNGLTLKTTGVFGGSGDALILKVANGQVTYTLEAYLHLRKAQNVTAVYSGNSIYDDSRSATKKAQILLRNATLDVTTQKIGRQNTNITFTAKITDITFNKTANVRNNTDAYVFFKINGQTIRDKNNDTLKVKVVNSQAQLNYTLPNGMGGITSQNHSQYKQYTVLAGYVNPDYYPNARDNDSFIIERANISFDVKDIVFNNKSKKLNIKSNIITDTNVNAKGQNVVIVKINGATFKNATTAKPMLYVIQDGVIDIDLTLSQKVNSIDSVELVTGERLVYLGSRYKTSDIKVLN